MSTFYQRVQRKGMHFNHVCEVGVYEPETSNVLDFIKHNIRTTLVEADPDVAKRVVRYFSDYPVTVHPVAIWDFAGTQKMARARASTFVIDLKLSPTLANDHYQIRDDNTFEVESKPFSAIDDGTIDLLSIDIEGGEWYVLKHMVSRPRIISIETHGKNYINPFMPEIVSWMEQNGYRIWYKDNTDSIYSQQASIAPSLSDRLALAYKNVRIIMRRKKGVLLRKLGIR